jgi:hypothetical protein
MQGFPKTISLRQDIVNLLADPAYAAPALALVQTLMDERYGWVPLGEVPLADTVTAIAGHRVLTDYDDRGTATARHLSQWMVDPNNALTRMGITVAEAVAWGCADRAVPPPVDDVAALRMTAVARLDAWTDARMFGTFTDSKGVTYKANAAVRQWMTGLESKLAGGMTLPDGFVWDDADGNHIPHTTETFKALTTEITFWTDALYRTCTAAQAAVKAAGDALAIDAVLLGIVWP